MNKKNLSILGALALTATIGIGSVYAAEMIGTATGKDGDIKDIVRIQAAVTQVDGSHVSFVDQTDGQEYTAGFGPSRFTKAYEVGEQVTVEGVQTDADNEHGHNFQALKVNDTVLREAFEAKPAWAGQGRNGEHSSEEGLERGAGMGQGRHSAAGSRGSGECPADVSN